METFLGICALTTAIAAASVLWAGQSRLEGRALPWTAGILLGLTIFWILPEMAEDQGWILTLIGVSGILVLLAWIDRYVYPICPFCAVGTHSSDPAHGSDSCRHAATLGWPVLIFGCIHVFFDGWTIGLSQAAWHSSWGAALSWGVTVHKIPESVAIGVLAVRLTPTRKMAFGAVFLIQVVMAAGGLLSLLAGKLDDRWAEISAMPACAFLLFFGLLTLHQEWRRNGRFAAMRAAAPGLLGSGLAAWATAMLGR